MLVWQKRFHQLTPSPINLTVVQGDDDQTVDWRFNVKAIARQFPNAAFCMIKDGRHHLAGENGVYFEQVLKAIDQHL
jgi:lysophospholipase